MMTESLKAEIERVEREGLDYWSGLDCYGHAEMTWVTDDSVAPTARDVIAAAEKDHKLIVLNAGDTDADTAINLYRLVAEHQYMSR